MSEAEEWSVGQLVACIVIFNLAAAGILWLAVSVIIPVNVPRLFAALYERLPVVIVGYEVFMLPAFFMLPVVAIWSSILCVAIKIKGWSSTFVKKFKRGGNTFILIAGVLGVIVAPLVAKGFEFYVMSHGYEKCDDLTNFGVGVYQPGYVSDPWFCVPPEQLNGRLKANGYDPVDGARFE